jgi:hypothetical protein
MFTACRDDMLTQVGSKAQQVQQTLPLPPSFILIKTKTLTFDNTAGGITCYYGRSYQIMGSDVSAAQAVQLYSDLLRKAGWTAEGIQDAESPVLIQGDHTRLNLHSGNPGVDVQDVVDYRQIQATHRTIVTVRVDYLLPQRDGC